MGEQIPDTRNGSITFNLAAGQFSHSQPIIIDHPNTDKIYINGATLSGSLSSGSFGVTGQHSSTDGANVLTALRGVYATELTFTGGAGGIFVMSGTNAQGALATPMLKNVLLTGNGVAGTGLVVAGVGGLMLQYVSAHGFAGYGALFQNSQVWIQGAFSTTYNAGTGLVSWGATISHNANMYSCYNGNAGMSFENGGIDNDWSITGGVLTAGIWCRGNANMGVFATGAASVIEPGASYPGPSLVDYNGGSAGVTVSGDAFVNLNYERIQNNLGKGLWVQSVGGAAAGAADFTGNGSTHIYCFDGSNVNAAAATASGSSSNVTTSPAANTVGNNNSWITH